MSDNRSIIVTLHTSHLFIQNLRWLVFFWVCSFFSKVLFEPLVLIIKFYSM